MRRLTEGELQATVGRRPRPCGVGEQLWSRLEDYVASVPASDWAGHPPGAPGVPAAYAMPGGRWVHALVTTADRRVALVVVLDVVEGAVHGHRLLDLRPGPGRPGSRPAG